MSGKEKKNGKKGQQKSAQEEHDFVLYCEIN